MQAMATMIRTSSGVAREYADQGPLPDRDMEEDNQIVATLLKHMPSCMNADDIERLLPC
jgi:hypothetical protein